MKTSKIIAIAICLFGMSVATYGRPAEAPAANPYSDDIWSRSTLTGDWWGVRNQLAEKGITIDMSLTQAVDQGAIYVLPATVDVHPNTLAGPGAVFRHTFVTSQ